jgi:hypothetical protein
MTEPTREVVALEISIDSIARDAVKDVPRMIALMQQLLSAREELKAKDDGGLTGAIRAALAIHDYFAARCPDWNDAGLLNSLSQIMATLKALRDGGTSEILTANFHRIKRQRLSTEKVMVRGYASALVDLYMKRGSCSEYEACKKVAKALKSVGMRLGPRGKDVNTIKNWRKTAKGGVVDVDLDATAFERM